MVTLVEQLSVAVAIPVLVGLSPSPNSTVRFVGQVRTGGIVSSTVILWLTSAKLPQSSVTRYTRVTVPGHLPVRPLSLMNANWRVDEQVSEAVPPAAWNIAKFVYASGMS